MSEPELYLRFFKRQWRWFVLPTLLIGSIFLLKSILAPAVYRGSAMYVNFPKEKVLESVAEIDSVVAVVRSKSLNKELSLSDQLVVYKPAPLVMNVEYSSPNMEEVNSTLGNVDEYLLSHYYFQQVGSRVISREKSLDLVGMLVGLFLGIFSGLVIAVSREYFLKSS